MEQPLPLYTIPHLFLKIFPLGCCVLVSTVSASACINSSGHILPVRMLIKYLLQSARSKDQLRPSSGCLVAVLDLICNRLVYRLLFALSVIIVHRNIHAICLDRMTTTAVSRFSWLSLPLIYQCTDRRTVCLLHLMDETVNFR